MDANVNLRAELLRRVCLSLPIRRYQAYHWLGRVLEPKEPYVANFSGGRFEVKPREVSSIMATYCGFYQREITLWFRRYCRDAGGVFIDVGAEFGFFPMLADRCSHRRLRTYAFEPDPAKHVWLKRNLALNPGIHAESIPEAITGKTTLDAFCKERGLSKVGLVKIDVDGAEKMVFGAMKEGIASGVYERILIELRQSTLDGGERERDVCTALNALLQEKYRASELVPFETRGGYADKMIEYYRMTWTNEFLRPIPWFGPSDLRGKNRRQFVLVHQSVPMFPSFDLR